MFTHVTSKPRRHRRVIHEDGTPAESTQRLPRLRFALFGEVPDREGGAWLAQAEPRVPAALTAPTRTLPVMGHGVVEMRVPSAPQPPTEPLPAVDPYPSSLFDDPSFVTDLTLIQMKAHHDVYDLKRGFDSRMGTLLERVESLGRRVRVWTIESMDLDLRAAYAEGGTERVLKLTPEVLARLDAAKAPAGTQVAA